MIDAIIYFIKHPPKAIVLSLLLFAVGFVAMFRLEVRQYPVTDKPVISIRTSFRGASPDIIESQITKPLENALSSISGLDEITSVSENGESKIVLHFKLDRNIEDAANDVRAKVSKTRATSDFPRNIPESEITKTTSDAKAMMSIVLFSDDKSLKDLSDYARNVLENQLLVVPGIASVNTFGGGRYQMHIHLDPVKLANYQLTTEDVSNAIRSQNVEKPVGYVVTEDKNISVTTKANLVTEEDFEDVIVKRTHNYLVRVRDLVQDVSFDSIEDEVDVRYKGKPAVELAIVKQSIANELDISQAIRKMFPDLVSKLPQGIQMEIALDNSIYIERSLGEVKQTIIEATVLVILVILFFLRSFRASLIPIVTIPLSLVGSFAIMYFLGFTINTLTLLALVMAIGLVVDDAIVVLENIYRHIEKGETPMKAAFLGSKEIGSAVVAMTITLAAVYAPIALSTGATGKLFAEFSVTLAGAVILSGIIALTLSPMMSSRFLKLHKAKVSKKDQKHPGILLMKKADIYVDKFLGTIDRSYSKSLEALNRYWILILGAGIALFGLFLLANVKQEMSSPEDQGRIYIKANIQGGTNLKFLKKYMIKSEKLLDELKVIDRYIAVIRTGGDTYFNAYLVPWEERDISSKKVAQLLRPKFKNITAFDFNVTGESRGLIGGTGDYPIQVTIQTSKSNADLYEQFDLFVKDLQNMPSIKRGIQVPRRDETKQYVVEVDRAKAAIHGVNIEKLTEMVNVLFAKVNIGYFKSENTRYPISLQLSEPERTSPEDILGLYVRGTTETPRGTQETLVPLIEVVNIIKQTTPNAIAHSGGFRSATLDAQMEPGYSLLEVLDDIKRLADATLPEGFEMTFSGASKKFLDERQTIVLIFLLAIVFIYLVLAFQYNSFIDPLIIMVSVPLSLVGGLFTLMYVGGSFEMINGEPHYTTGTLTIFAQIGMVTLVGLITKHGILIVEFANKLLEEGQSRLEAAYNAAKVRLRPILMTTLAMVAGALPLALAAGPGSESRQEIGWVIVGGMAIGTLFTLYVLPVVYVFLTAENLKKLVCFWRWGK